MAELTSKSGVKELLGIPAAVATWDALITSLVEGAEDEIRRLCGKGDGVFASLSRTEKRTGSGMAVVYLTHRPVTAIASVKVYGSSTSYTTIDSTLYRINDEASGVLLAEGCYLPWEAGGPDYRASGLRRSYGRVPGAFPYTEIVYTGGYAAVPDDLEEAARWYAANLFADRKVNPNLQSEKLDKFGYTVATPGPDGRSPRRVELERRLRPFIIQM